MTVYQRIKIKFYVYSILITYSVEE